MNLETVIQNQSMLTASDAGALVWRQQVGLFRKLHQPKQIVSVGVSGMSDLMMVVPVTITPDMVGRTIGAAVSAEIKTATGKQRENQAAWQSAFEKRGGVYALVREPAEMVDLIERVKRGNYW